MNFHLVTSYIQTFPDNLDVQQYFLQLVNVVLNVLGLACWKSKHNIRWKLSTKQNFEW